MAAEVGSVLGVLEAAMTGADEATQETRGAGWLGGPPFRPGPAGSDDALVTAPSDGACISQRRVPSGRCSGVWRSVALAGFLPTKVAVPRSGSGGLKSVT